MRDIKRIFIHCTASNQNLTIPNLLMEFKQRGWKLPGYHIAIDKYGNGHRLLDDSIPSNGVRGYNNTAINIAWIGGIDGTGKPVDNRTEMQKKALIEIVKAMHKKYPHAQIMGHRDISPDKNHNGIVDPWERIKACPCFDAMVEYKDIQNS